MLKNDITWEAPRYPSQPPWRRTELCVDISVSKEGNKQQNPEITATVAKEKIDRSRNNLNRIYTQTRPKLQMEERLLPFASQNLTLSAV